MDGMDSEQFARVWSRVSGESCPNRGSEVQLLRQKLELCASAAELYRRLGYSRALRERQEELQALQTEYFILTAEKLPLLPHYEGESSKPYLLRECINLEERSALLHSGSKWQTACRKRAEELRAELGRVLSSL